MLSKSVQSCTTEVKVAEPEREVEKQAMGNGVLSVWRIRVDLWNSGAYPMQRYFEILTTRFVEPGGWSSGSWVKSFAFVISQIKRHIQDHIGLLLFF